MGGEVPDSGDSPSDKSIRFYIWSQVFRIIYLLVRAAMWIALAYIGFGGRYLSGKRDNHMGIAFVGEIVSWLTLGPSGKLTAMGCG